MIVDCGNIVVQILVDKTREALKLEQHWSRTEDEYFYAIEDEDEAYDEFTSSMPIPDDYLTPKDIEEAVIDDPRVNRKSGKFRQKSYSLFKGGEGEKK
jgi:hypothetical protein